MVVRSKGVTERRREALAPRLLIQKHQVVYLFTFETPPADLHQNLAALERLERLFGCHGPGGSLVTTIARPHVDRPAADLTDVALLLGTASGEAGDVSEGDKDTGQVVFA